MLITVRLDAAAVIGYTEAVISVNTKTHIGSDGTLTLEVPLPLRESLGWPSDFFGKTAGVWQGKPLERGPQDEYEVREELT